MSKKIFIVGGSYFVGRVFCIQAARSDEFELTVMNRGRTPIRKPNIREFKCDRNNLDAFKADVAPQIAGEVFDAVIDTCAYEPGQIRNTIAMMAGQIRHYIYISTASVYSTDDLSERCEDDPVMDEPKTSTEMSDYVYKKLLLEYELKDACAQHGIEYTILRPAMIFGPFNYAPRESRYIELIARHNAVPVLVGAPAKFSMVYVLDISRILQMIPGDERAFGQIFNLAAPEIITRDFFYDSLERFNGEPYNRQEYTLDQAPSKDIPLTMPTVYDELYNGQKICRVFDFAYTPYDEAMKKTFDIFKNIYTS